MYCKGHYLKKNHCNRIPKRAVFLDTESVWVENPHNPNQKIHEFRLGVAKLCYLRNGEIEAQETVEFKTPDIFYNALDGFLSKRETVWIFAHNLPFDLTLIGFWDCVDRGWGTITSYVIDSPPTIINAVRNGRKIKLVDTLNYWRMSLADIGASFGLIKWPLPRKHDSDLEWLAYCGNDVDIIDQAIVGLTTYCHKNDLGNFAPTISGIAWNAYRHRFMDTAILIHGIQEVINLERAAYYGGRVKVNYLGEVKSPVHVLDVNSQYPHIMRELQLPCRLAAYKLRPSLSDLKAFLKNGTAVANVHLKTQGQQYPYRMNGTVYYPEGEYPTVLAGPELRRAIACGEVVKVYEAAAYETDYLFRKFVDFFYQEKLKYAFDGNHLARLQAKSILNSLSGKFGQRAHSWVPDPDVRCRVRWGTWAEPKMPAGEVYSFRSFGGVVQRHQAEGSHPDAFVAIPATITSAARIQMDTLEFSLGRGAVYYQDTDSVHVSENAFHSLQLSGLVHPWELGRLKHEAEYHFAEYRGWKNYSLEDRHVIAGVKRNAVELGDKRYRQSKFHGIEDVLVKGPVNQVLVDDEVIVLRFPPGHFQGRELKWVEPIQIGPEGIDWPACPDSDNSSILRINELKHIQLLSSRPRHIREDSSDPGE